MPLLELRAHTSWREAASALRALRERKFAGKAVLHLDQSGAVRSRAAGAS